jgi:hypothetical protein
MNSRGQIKKVSVAMYRNKKGIFTLGYKPGNIHGITRYIDVSADVSKLDFDQIRNDISITNGTSVVESSYTDEDENYFRFSKKLNMIIHGEEL